jgi:hypothetical protein
VTIVTTAQWQAMNRGAVRGVRGGRHRRPPLRL